MDRQNRDAFHIFFMCSFIACGQVRDIGDFLTTEILVETPIQMIMIIFTLTSLIGVRLGLEVICRSAVIFFLGLIMFFSYYSFYYPTNKIRKYETTTFWLDKQGRQIVEKVES